jgi:uncharacterized protein
MALLPEIVLNAWEDRTAPIVLSTVDKSGIPNSIYATCTWIFDSQTIIVADNYFDKTLQNILDRSKGSILFITNDKTSYQIKGSIEYHKSGEMFDYMKKLNPGKLPGKAVVALKVEKVYSGSKIL